MKLLPNKGKQIFRVHVKHYYNFDGGNPTQYYTFFHTPGNSEILRELLANNTTYFYRVYIKQY